MKQPQPKFKYQQLVVYAETASNGSTAEVVGFAVGRIHSAFVRNDGVLAYRIDDTLNVAEQHIFDAAQVLDRIAHAMHGRTLT